ncbi:MAG: TonB family protein [Tidjanibacter sp.]|nr:TonB family protein [Tidjanibacter sp.]MBR2425001.1 TonB family protein [Tidjanibacter sp.]MBR3682643.1 TonB family protein [Tidjanibacter sp.]MBR3853576.1 TonB family protein [Tidjanibacter sp.]MBR7128701.1 TonB family protein [Tidjanibacter sp.]
MEVKKNPNVDLQNKKGIFLEIGLIFALALCVVAFSLGQSKKSIEIIEVSGPEVEMDLVDITKPEEPKTQAPVKQAVQLISDFIKVVKNDTKIETEFDFAEFTEEEIVVEEIEVAPEEIVEEAAFIKVEVMPSFMGGDLNTFRMWVAQEFKIPAIAAENGIQGKVVVQFVIEKDGRLSSIEFLQSPDRVYEDEVRRVLMKSPKWTPGRQRDAVVRVRYILPIDCRLQ